MACITIGSSSCTVNQGETWNQNHFSDIKDTCVQLNPIWNTDKAWKGPKTGCPGSDFSEIIVTLILSETGLKKNRVAEVGYPLLSNNKIHYTSPWNETCIKKYILVKFKLNKYKIIVWSKSDSLTLNKGIQEIDMEL